MVRTKEEALDFLKAKFDEQLPGWEAKQKSWYEGYCRHHTADVASFDCKFKRWGDFLTISICRGELKEAATVNLSRVKNIHMTAGTLPQIATGTPLKYFAVKREARSVTHGGYSINDAAEAAHEGFVFEIEWPVAIEERWLFPYNGRWVSLFIDDSDDNAFRPLPQGGPYPLPFPINEVASHAKDDNITLSGALTIPCPAGTGEQTLNAMLEEIKAGMDPVSINITATGGQNV